LELRPYQIDIINQTIQTNASTLIQVPTGGGKTVIAKEIALTLTARDQHVLFIAPKIILMDQTADVFKGMKPHIVHGNNKYDPNHHILISTIQTAVNRKDLNPDVIIVDEVHHGYSGKNLEELKLAHPNSRIIGLSATPYDKDGVLLKGFDIVLDDYDVDYMIENGYLVHIEAFTAVHQNLSNIRIVAGDYDKAELGKLMGNRNAVLEVVNATKERIEKSKKTIVFAVDINHAKLLTEAYKQAGLMTNVLHSEQDKQEQKNIIEHFKKGHLKILVSVLMLTTGFDVPDTDTAVIARPTKSQNLYKQMVGRIMRLSPGKTHGTLLDCGNVIGNLGNPTDPIKERIKSNEVNGKHLCSSCGSNKLYPKKEGEKIFWICSVCGYKKEAKEARLYRCEACKKNYGHNAKLHLDDQALTLICECGHHTVISTPQCNEVLTPVFDPKRIELVTKRFINQYESLIVKYFGIEELRNTKIQTHIKELRYAIKQNPERFYSIDLEKFISSENKFFGFDKIFMDENNTIKMKISLHVEEIGESSDKLTLSTINTLKFISQKYKESDDLKSTYLGIKNEFTFNDAHKSNMMNPMRKANDAILYFFTGKLWQDGFVYLSIENLLAVARMTKILDYIENTYVEQGKIPEKRILKIFHEFIEASLKNMHLAVLTITTNKIISQKIKKDINLIFDFNEEIEKTIRNIAKNLKIADDDIDDLFDIIVYSILQPDVENTTQLSTITDTNTKIVEQRIFESPYPKISEIVYTEGRFIKNPEVSMKFINLAIEAYQSDHIDNIKKIFEEIGHIIESETKNAKIKNVHKEILQQVNKVAFEAKKFGIWTDSFTYLSFENFQAIMQLFSSLAEYLNTGKKIYTDQKEEVSILNFANQVRAELHNIDKKCIEIWNQEHPGIQIDKTLTNLKKFNNFYNETIASKIHDVKKIITITDNK
jgi:superfamily II DNA or RNA helicase